VLAGTLGNLLNALAHLAMNGGHLSVGFSTAVFGAAGALAGLKAASGDGDFRPGAMVGRNMGRGWLPPVAAGLALVASLGTAGDNTDIGAHVFGLLAGLGLGGLAGRMALRLGRPDEWAHGRCNDVCGVAAALIPALAWAWGWLAR
jgi:membrane associated rhomboid family serine protease